MALVGGPFFAVFCVTVPAAVTIKSDNGPEFVAKKVQDWVSALDLLGGELVRVPNLWRSRCRVPAPRSVRAAVKRALRPRPL